MASNKNTFNVYLLRNGIKDIDSPLKTDFQYKDKVEHYELKNPLVGKAHVWSSRPHPPAWVKKVDSAIEGDVLAKLKIKSASALLIVKANKRYFAVTYGHGLSYLNQNYIVRGFGLKVVLNAIDPEKIRSLSTKTIEGNTLSTKKDSSQISELSFFAPNAARDLIKKITAVPMDTKLFGARLSGSDAIKLSLNSTILEFNKIAEDLLEYYKKENYKNSFAWIDNLQPIIGEKIEELNGLLDGRLKSKNYENMHLALSESPDWEDIEGFYFYEETKKNVPTLYADTTLDDAFRELGQRYKRDFLDVRFLKDKHFYLQYSGSSNSKSNSYYHSLIFEISDDSGTYILSDSQWFMIERDWLKQVHLKVSNINVNHNLYLPISDYEETEPVYNKKAANEIKALPLDAQSIPYGVIGSKVEVCDILTEKELIHVKRKIKSSTLSHLFNQGVVSAKLLKNRKDFRDKVIDKFKESYKEISDIITADIPSKLEVVYVIIAPNSENFTAQNLPFFSQLSLLDAIEELTDLGYKFSIKFVEAKKELVK
ncbi:MAG: TIGR04141 family sporadically distributed protein [Bifidobacteriaceae bacterium]|jgi:uncharacterized protein (TIGR04141 family)|nr:TIGR04141 family sporadically distributed protein [Bifidobacteriaceae bacterium]